MTIRVQNDNGAIVPYILTAELREFNSSKLFTVKTSAVIPSGGVPMLLPRPKRGRFCLRGNNKVADSFPLRNKSNNNFQLNP